MGTGLGFSSVTGSFVSSSEGFLSVVGAGDMVKIGEMGLRGDVEVREGKKGASVSSSSTSLAFPFYLQHRRRVVLDSQQKYAVDDLEDNLNTDVVSRRERGSARGTRDETRRLLPPTPSSRPSLTVASGLSFPFHELFREAPHHALPSTAAPRRENGNK